MRDDPTVLAARREMQSWRRLSLEPSALRTEDRYTDPRVMDPDGRHLAAALHRIAAAAEGNGGHQSDVYARVAARLGQLAGVRVDQLRVDSNDARAAHRSPSRAIRSRAAGALAFRRHLAPSGAVRDARGSGCGGRLVHGGARERDPSRQHPGDGDTRQRPRGRSPPDSWRAKDTGECWSGTAGLIPCLTAPGSSAHPRRRDDGWRSLGGAWAPIGGSSAGGRASRRPIARRTVSELTATSAPAARRPAAAARAR